MPISSRQRAQQARAEKARRRLARVNFRDFTHYTFESFKENWHHRRIMEILHGAANFDPEYRKTIITAPPRHGKSELVSVRLPAYFLGKRPELEVLHVTYGDDLSEDMGTKVGDVLETQRFREVFPNFRLEGRNTKQKKQTHKGGWYRAIGLKSGGITGTGANLLIIDDPITNRKAAESPKTREHIWEAFQDDLLSRMEFPWAIVVLATRWHKDDLTGRILDADDKDEWNHIHLPWICDYHEYDEEHPDYDPRSPGDPLWPGVSTKRDYAAMEGVNVDPPSHEELVQMELEKAEKMQQDRPYKYYSLYQGRPIGKSGNLIAEAWLKQYNSTPQKFGAYCQNKIISIDANQKAKAKSQTSSDAAIVVGGRKADGSLALLDADWGNWSFIQLKKRAKVMAEKWPGCALLIENKASGAALINSLEDDYKVIPYEPKGVGKVDRALTLADWAEAGKVLLPTRKNAPWVEEARTIITEFPSHPKDDVLDALAQLASHYDSRSHGLQELRRVTGYADR